MSVQLAVHHLEFLSLKGGCVGPSMSIHVKMPHCLKSHVAAHIVFDFHLCILFVMMWNVLLSVIMAFPD